MPNHTFRNDVLYLVWSIAQSSAELQGEDNQHHHHLRLASLRFITGLNEALVAYPTESAEDLRGLHAAVTAHVNTLAAQYDTDATGDRAPLSNQVFNQVVDPYEFDAATVARGFMHDAIEDARGSLQEHAGEA